MKVMWCDLSHAVERNTRAVVVQRALHRRVDPRDDVLIALEAQCENGQVPPLLKDCLVTVNECFVRRHVKLTADNRLDACLLGSFVEGRGAAKPTMFGQRDSAPPKLNGASDHAFR